jgi:hypothetical protein
LPVALRDAGRTVHLANLSFAELELLDRQVWLADGVAAITPNTAALDDYFPERALARWLPAMSGPRRCTPFPVAGCSRCAPGYRALVDHLGVDAVVLVDGGQPAKYPPTDAGRSGGGAIW